MNEEQLSNQSKFATDQEDLNAPPEFDMSPEAVAKRQAVERKRFKIGMMVMVGIIVFICLLVTANRYINKPAPYIPPPTPTPLPPLTSTKTQDELARLQFFVDQANPNVEYIAPPTLDMNTKF
jgi:hypothetical protein